MQTSPPQSNATRPRRLESRIRGPRGWEEGPTGDSAVDGAERLGDAVVGEGGLGEAGPVFLEVHDSPTIARASTTLGTLVAAGDDCLLGLIGLGTRPFRTQTF